MYTLTITSQQKPYEMSDQSCKKPITVSLK